MTQTTSIVLIVLTAILALATLLLALLDKNIGKRKKVTHNGNAWSEVIFNPYLTRKIRRNILKREIGCNRIRDAWHERMCNQ